MEAILRKKLIFRNLLVRKAYYVTFISKSLFNLKGKGYQEGTFGAAKLLSSWMHFMCVRKYLEVFCGLHRSESAAQKSRDVVTSQHIALAPVRIF